jgi:hypothetical protein
MTGCTASKMLQWFCIHYIPVVLSLLLYSPPAGAQAPANYGILNQSQPGLINTPGQFQPVFPSLRPQPGFTNPLGPPPVNRLITPSGNNIKTGPAFSDNTKGINQQAVAETEPMLEEMARNRIAWLTKTKHYRQAYDELCHLNPDSFSLTRATYAVENAYFDGKLPYDRYMGAIQMRADEVRKLLKREQLSTKNNLALNYGIQRLYQKPITYYDSRRKRMVTIKPFKYDLYDFDGKKDYTKLLTAKLLSTDSGQCLSMPKVYLMIAEQLGAKAWLSLSPQHSFIKFSDGQGRMLNFETTNGNLVSSSFLAQCGYITSQAVKNRAYLDTLSQRRLYAVTLFDLLWGYLNKFEYDDFAETVKNKILQLDSNNLPCLMLDANVKWRIALNKIRAAGKPKPADLPKYPEAYKAFLTASAASDRVDNLGYQDMPPDAYQQWLQSIEKEKKKQSAQELAAHMQREINALKQMKSTIQTKRD